MSKSEHQEVLSRIPYGVSIVTVGVGGVENGLAISWLSQVSFDPPMIMFAIDKGHYSADLLNDNPVFVVNLLKEGQLKIATHFARQSMVGDDKLDAYSWHEAQSGCAILDDALAYYDCEVVAAHEAGDHLLIVGEVKDAGILNDGTPLTSLHGIRYAK